MQTHCKVESKTKPIQSLTFGEIKNKPGIYQPLAYPESRIIISHSGYHDSFISNVDTPKLMSLNDSYWEEINTLFVPVNEKITIVFDSTQA